MRRRERRSRLTAVASSGPSHDRWLISYADFVTLLLAVFIVLFAFALQTRQNIGKLTTAIHSGFDSLSIAKAPKANAVTNAIPKNPVIAQALPASSASSKALPAASAPPKPPPAAIPAPTFNTAELNKQLSGVLGDAIDRKEIVMQQTPDGLIISLRELGFFKSGQAKLLPGAADKLERTAQVLMSHGLEVRVEGHSDDQPIHNALFSSNWELSTARAMSVLSMLVDHADFPPTHISVAGYGPYHPVDTNDTTEGRRQNRRVDLVVIAPRSQVEELR